MGNPPSPPSVHPARPLRTALIGAGIFAKRTHLPTILSQSGSFSLRAIYSRSLKSATALHEAIPDTDFRATVRVYHEEDTSNDLTALLADPEIDVVVIALPVGAQEAVVKRALQSGKHVLSEKPVAGTAAAARELVDWYATTTADYKQNNNNNNSARPVWLVAENWRAEEAVKHAATLVRTRGRGRVRTFALSCLLETKPDNAYVATGWRVGDKSVVTGGFLMDGGVHWVAMLRACVGLDVDRVAAFTSLCVPYCAPVDTVSGAIMLAPNPSDAKAGAAGTVNICFAASGRPFEIALKVVCETGTVSVRCGPAKSGGGARVFTVDWTPEGGEKEETWEFGFGGIEAEFQQFAELVTSGTASGSPAPDLTPQQALADVLVVEALIKSGEQGGVPVCIIEI
ncbi:hypothetical protein HDU86_006890 [Geranomyces michiganensis]|nr:hypothetical protein HDU86_006890 [Geranomyces michiganensis]